MVSSIDMRRRGSLILCICVVQVDSMVRVVVYVCCAGGRKRLLRLTIQD